MGLKMRPAFLMHEEEVKGEQHMTIQDAIDKAVKGGYHIYGFGWDGYRLRRSHEGLFRVHAER
jgi:hypothetical protein